MDSNIFCSKGYAVSRAMFILRNFTIKVFLNSHVSYSQGEKNHGNAGDTAHMTK